jgi:predicted ArsR family transcriptional regulator
VSDNLFLMNDETHSSPDHLNTIGVLKRREVEVRLLAPLLDRLGDEFGDERVLEITRQVIVDIARHQGVQLARRMGGCSLAHFVESLADWQMDDALQLAILEQSQNKLSFDVTRCRYAEMYRGLGVPELGTLLSCNRDQALIEGFNDRVSLTRTQTIMEGAAYCDFRYVLHKGV